MNSIVQGTAKNERIGQKIYVRYITVNLELESASSANPADFPYVRIIFAKDRAANTIISSDLPVERLERPNVNKLAVLSDNTLGMDSDFPGTSVANKAIIKLTKTFKMFTSF